MISLEAKIRLTGIFFTWGSTLPLPYAIKSKFEHVGRVLEGVKNGGDTHG